MSRCSAGKTQSATELAGTIAYTPPLTLTLGIFTHQPPTLLKYFRITKTSSIWSKNYYLNICRGLKVDALRIATISHATTTDIFSYHATRSFYKLSLFDIFDRQSVYFPQSSFHIDSVNSIFSSCSVQESLKTCRNRLNTVVLQ